MALAAVVASLSITSDPADARTRRKHHYSRAKVVKVAKARRPAVSSYNPPYAAIVLDAKTGAVLHQSNPDSLRHPASLTKIMTLYMLFERLEAGKITLNTEMDVSREASIQAPTKLGLKPGSTLRVEDAIKGLVTRSANDAAVVIAETIGGSEAEFARMMTRKARSLGMTNTTYHNASGLPDDDQITSARDQALLGIAIQERFPKYYRYFSLPSFVFRGKSIRNHNHLLGSVEGVDGIKTGYVRASGFNLVTSVRRGSRHIVAVVMGGRSAGSRDARMRDLIEAHIDDASTKPSSGALVASADKVAPAAVAVAAPAPRIAAPDEAPVTFVAPPAPEVRPAEATAALPEDVHAPIQPVKVKTLTVKLLPSSKTMPIPSAAPAPAMQLAAAAPQPEPAPAPAAAPKPEPAAHTGVLGKLPAMIAAAKNVAVTSAKAEEVPAPVRVAAVAPTTSKHHTTRGGWAIQIGAYEDEGEAKQKLSSAKGKIAKVFERAEGYIERTVKGAKTYYRARFAGFDQNQAENTCKKLKKTDVACMATKI